MTNYIKNLHKIAKPARKRVITEKIKTKFSLFIRRKGWYFLLSVFIPNYTLPHKAPPKYKPLRPISRLAKGKE